MSSLPRHRIRLCLLRGLVVAGLLVGPSSFAVVSTTVADAGLAARIDTLIGQPRFAHASWGIAVISLDSGRTLYTHRADRLAQPASTAKLFTAALSLATLGADYRFPTRLLSRGTIHHGRLEGHLVLRGMGDPTLGTEESTEWAAQLASQLSAHGVRQVQGDLVADDSYFTGPSSGSGWEAGDLQSWFAVPSSALSVDENVVRITVTPGASQGRSARIELVPADGIAKVVGRIDTTQSGTPSDINLYRALGSPTLHVFGSIPAQASPAHFRLAMDDPALQAARQLRAALAKRGIRIRGNTRVLHWPLDDGATLAHVHVLGELLSPPLLEILRRGLKRSQNLYLQNLLLSAGVHEQANSDSPPEGFRDSEGWGIHALRDLLDRIGIAPEVSQIVEGTGLSRHNLVTPDAMVRLLVYLAARPYAAQLRDALPLAGVDGTLAHRMRGTVAAGNVQAKTGNMSHVHSVAGYVTTTTGERLAFAIMLDNYEPPEGAPPASRDLDAIIVLLANDRRGD